MPAGKHFGVSQQRGMPGNGERIEKGSGLIFPELGRKVFETVAGNEDDEIFVEHPFILAMSGRFPKRTGILVPRLRLGTRTDGPAVRIGIHRTFKTVELFGPA
jgi:hypothetical protein